MRHPRFKPAIFTALNKNRNFRPLSCVLASMHSTCFTKKRMFSFCPFSFVFCEFNKSCRLLSFCCFSTRNNIFLLVIWGQPGNEPGTSSTLSANHTTIPLSHDVSVDTFLPFSRIKIIPFLFLFPRISEFNTSF